MATYKVIQDIEADDTLIGPLSLKQCIYAALAVATGYGCFYVTMQGASFLVPVLLPFTIFGAFFAFPWSKQQPTEIWALAKIRFFLKPRKRIWDQTGASDLVTITAPKKVEKNLTDGLSQDEVRSRLKALADTIDTRGWAVKNAGIMPYSLSDSTSERLISPVEAPQLGSMSDTSVFVDMMDEKTNPRAQQLEQMMQASATAHRERLVRQMEQPQTIATAQPTPASQPAPTVSPQPTNGGGPLPTGPASYWYLNHPLPVDTAATQSNGGISTSTPLAVAVEPTAEEEMLIKKSRHLGPASSYENLRTIQPISTSNDPQSSDDDQAIMGLRDDNQVQTNGLPEYNLPAPISNDSTSPVTPTFNPATLELANNNDLTVATIAREAHRQNDDSSDEVVVTLR